MPVEKNDKKLQNAIKATFVTNATNAANTTNAAARAPRFLIAAGGTSGHINPALSIAEELCSRRPDSVVEFVGTARGLEATLVPAAGYPFNAVAARGFPRKPSKELLPAIRDYLKGRRQSRELIRCFQPDVVIGTGGYVCGPAAAAAVGAGIPVALHEQNAFPGRANRFLARKSQLIMVSFPDTERYFPAGKRVVLTGNPVRAAFFTTNRESARQKLDISAEEKLLLVLGGSLGARTLNEATLAAAAAPVLQSTRIILACGKLHVESITAAAAGYPNLSVFSYIENMHDYMAAADLIVCRAGAITCAEVAALGRPSIMVPYPYAAGDHQTANARSFADRGASLLCPDSEFTGAWLIARLQELLPDQERLTRMGAAAAGLAKPDAASDIADEIETLLPPGSSSRNSETSRTSEANATGNASETSKTTGAGR